MKKLNPEDCVRCGRCISVCPSYKFFLKESYSPRGRIFLLSKNLESQSLDYCLFCENCAQLCPQGLSFPQFYFQRLLRTEKSFFYLSDPLKFLKPLPLFSSLIQDFEEKFLEKNKEGDFYLYLSCGLKHLYPQAFFTFLKRLSKIRLKPLIPPFQDCCGIFNLSFGTLKTLKEHGLKKIRLFSEKKPIVIFCATCYWVFKKVYPLLFEGTPWEKDFESLSERSIFATDFLQRNLETPLSFLKSSKILYHCPCHIKDLTFKKEGIKDILEAQDFCCGSAKITLWLENFPIEFTKLWKKRLLGKKVLATACTGCYLNFSLLLRKPPEIKHWLELWEERPIPII